MDCCPLRATGGAPGSGWGASTAATGNLAANAAIRTRFSAAEAKVAPRYAAIRRRRRFAFTAKHTKSHSPRTFASLRRLKHRKPSTCLIEPHGASDNHFRSAYTDRPAGVDSFLTMRPVAGCFFRLRAATCLFFRKRHWRPTVNSAACSRPSPASTARPHPPS